MRQILLFAVAVSSTVTIAAGANGQPLYALDLVPPLTESDARCLKICLYSAVFLRAFSPSSPGGFEPAVCSSIQNARKAGLGVEVYMLPFAPQIQDGIRQFDTLYAGLKGCQITFQRVWLVVTSPPHWYNNAQQSIYFINQVIDRARQHGIAVGIYTSENDWGQITGMYTGFATTPLLWYWNVFRQGPLGETAMNFGDFRPFGQWRAPMVKQFGQASPVCGHTVNRDTYYATTGQTAANSISIGNATYVGSIAFD